MYHSPCSWAISRTVRIIKPLEFIPFHVSAPQDIQQIKTQCLVETCLGQEFAAQLYSEIAALKFKNWNAKPWPHELDAEKALVFTSILKCIGQKELKVAITRAGCLLAKMQGILAVKQDEKKRERAAEGEEGEKKDKRKARRQRSDPTTKAAKTEAKGSPVLAAPGGGERADAGSAADGQFEEGEMVCLTATKNPEGWNGEVVTILKMLSQTATVQRADKKVRVVSHTCLHKLTPEQLGAAGLANPAVGAADDPPGVEAAAAAALAEAARRATATNECRATWSAT